MFRNTAGILSRELLLVLFANLFVQDMWQNVFHGRLQLYKTLITDEECSSLIKISQLARINQNPNPVLLSEPAFFTPLRHSCNLIPYLNLRVIKSIELLCIPYIFACKMARVWQLLHY